MPKSLKGVAVFSFKRLCGEARGAADYLAIAQRFHTVILVGIPVMGREMRNEAARFVTLIDALYEHKVKLLAAADAEPAELYPAGDGSFEFAAHRQPARGNAAAPTILPRATADRLTAAGAALALRESREIHVMRAFAACTALDRCCATWRRRQSGDRADQAAGRLAGQDAGDVQDRDRNPDRRRARPNAQAHGRISRPANSSQGWADDDVKLCPYKGDQDEDAVA